MLTFPQQRCRSGRVRPSCARPRGLPYDHAMTAPSPTPRPCSGDPGAPPAVPRHAATIALLRRGAAGPEVYLMRRVSSMAFAAGLYVFPGGSVDPRDSDLEPTSTGPARPVVLGRPVRHRRAAGPRAGLRRGPGDLRGVGGAAGRARRRLGGDVSDPSWEDDRQALLDRSLSMVGLLERRGLVLRADLLRPWAHWITPELEPRRFDTKFFVAALPAGQVPRDVGGEADRVRLAAARGGARGPRRGRAGDDAAHGGRAPLARRAARRGTRPWRSEQVISPVLPRFVQLRRGAGAGAARREPGYERRRERRRCGSACSPPTPAR